MDNLQQLSNKTSSFFQGINSGNFALFQDYLQLVKTIALAQSQNKPISDTDFEKLRLSYSVLEQIMSPSPNYITHGEKGMRASIIADIFTSGEYGPYYLATGRPVLMIVLIDDNNGKRAVI